MVAACSVIRIDGDCDCHNLHQFPQCGIYRPYFKAFSTDMGLHWTRAEPIQGTGCARPRLLSFPPTSQLPDTAGSSSEAPVLISGGRICYANMTGLFIWLNPSGAADGEWERISVSAAHNEHCKAETFSIPLRASSSR